MCMRLIVICLKVNRGKSDEINIASQSPGKDQLIGALINPSQVS